MINLMQYDPNPKFSPQVVKAKTDLVGSVSAFIQFRELNFIYQVPKVGVEPTRA
jgi:hypothetical protein